MSTPDYNDATARITIGSDSFSGWIDYDRQKLRALNVDAWITWMEGRLPLALTGALDRVFTKDAPHHSTVNGSANGQDFSFYLCGVTLIACAIEGLGHFMTGTDESGKSFREWLKKYMPAWCPIVNWLWVDVRNGLAHQLSFKKGGVEHHDSEKYKTRQDGQVEMDPDAFYLDFKDGVQTFFRDLKSDLAMQRTFAQRFQSTFLA